MGDDMVMPRTGDVVRLDKRASRQFSMCPILLRVIAIRDWQTYDEWVWLDGYEINSRGAAVRRRTLFLHIPGIRVVAAR